MACRALSLTSGAQASSRSRNTWSAGRPWAFSRKRGLLPGTARQERRGRSRFVAVADGVVAVVMAVSSPLHCQRLGPGLEPMSQAYLVHDAPDDGGDAEVPWREHGRHALGAQRLGVT